MCNNKAIMSRMLPARCTLRQIGNLTRDRNYWGRPERANVPRPVVSLTSTRPGTDVVAMTAAALAAASIAIKEESSQVRRPGRKEGRACARATTIDSPCQVGLGDCK